MSNMVLSELENSNSFSAPFTASIYATNAHLRNKLKAVSNPDEIYYLVLSRVLVIQGQKKD